MFKKDISAGAKSKVKSSVQRALRAKITETYPLLGPHIDEIMPKKSQLDLLKLQVPLPFPLPFFPQTPINHPPPPPPPPGPHTPTSPPPHGRFPSPLTNVSCAERNSPDRVSLYVLATRPLFYQHMDDPLTPHLRLVHAFPQCFPRVRIDRGAVRFVLSGATLMAPGLTSAGGRLPSGKEGGGSGKEGDGSGKEGWGEEELEEGRVVVVEAEGKENAVLVGRLRMGTREVKDRAKGVVIDEGHFLGDGLWRLLVD